MNRSIYLDNNATTALAPEVRAAMVAALETLYGNPSSLHPPGQAAAHAIREARTSVASLIGAHASEIVFTSGGTEANAMAITGLASLAAPNAPIITSRVEHPAVLAPIEHLERRGHAVHTIGVTPSGALDDAACQHALSAAPGVAAFMWVNNESGVVFPIADIATTVRQSGGCLHVDAVQAAGKIPVNVQDMAVDTLALSAHKLHGPKGIGALYIRRGLKLPPLLGGGPQEQGRRAGTENLVGIVGFGKACECAAQARNAHSLEMARWRDRLEAGICETIPNVSINGADAPRAPNTSNVSFLHCEGESLLYHLADAGIFVSTGAACSSGTQTPSHVLRAMQLSANAVRGAIRFSLSRYTRGEDIDEVLSLLPGIVQAARR